MGQRRKKSSQGHFTALHEFMQATPAWASLSPAERAVYVELARRYRGANNGELVLGVREAAAACNISKNTAGRAFAVLSERGFVEVVTPAGFSRKDRVATVWRLTIHRCDVTHQPPGRGFMRWKPDQEEPRQEAPAMAICR